MRRTWTEFRRPPTSGKPRSALGCSGLLLFLLAVAASAEPPAPPRQLGYEVRAVHPHDPTAFTQGLFFEDGRFFESTGMYGRSTIREVEAATGRILRMERLPDQIFGEGLAGCGDRLVQLTWRARLGLVYEKASFRLLRTFPLPSEGWGLAWDGESLVMSDGTDRIRFLDPDSFAVRRTVRVKDADGRPVERLNELEMIRGRLWANVWQTDRIAVIDPGTGRLEAWLDLKGLLEPSARRGPDAVLNGIAWDAASDRVFVTGKLWPSLFEIRVFERPPKAR